MNRLTFTLCTLGAVLVLSACGERTHNSGAQSAAKRDVSPVTGTNVATFTQRDWKAGDQSSWAQQLKARAQYGMNDYTRTNH